MRRCSIVVICVTWQNSFLMSSLTGIGLCKSHFLLKKNEVTKLTAKDKMKKKKIGKQQSRKRPRENFS